MPYKIIHAHIKYPTSNNLTRPWNHAFVHPCLALSGEKDLRKRRETGRGGIPPGKAREYFHPGDPRPNSPLSRGVALNTTTRRGILFLPSPRRLSHPSSLPRSPLSTSRRLSQWEREERRSIRVDVLCTMACLRERRALTPKVVLTRLHVLPRIDVAPPPLFPPLSSSPVSRRVLALSRRVPSPLPTYRATSATRRRRPLLRPPHSTMARVTFTKYRDYS